MSTEIPNEWNFKKNYTNLERIFEERMLGWTVGNLKQAWSPISNQRFVDEFISDERLDPSEYQCAPVEPDSPAAALARRKLRHLYGTLHTRYLQAWCLFHKQKGGQE